MFRWLEPCKLQSIRVLTVVMVSPVGGEFDPLVTRDRSELTHQMDVCTFIALSLLSGFQTFSLTLS